MTLKDLFNPIPLPLKHDGFEAIDHPVLTSTALLVSLFGEPNGLISRASRSLAQWHLVYANGVTVTVFAAGDPESLEAWEQQQKKLWADESRVFWIGGPKGRCQNIEVQHAARQLRRCIVRKQMSIDLLVAGETPNRVREILEYDRPYEAQIGA